MEYCHSVSEKGSQRETDVYLVLVPRINEFKVSLPQEIIVLDFDGHQMRV